MSAFENVQFNGSPFIDAGPAAFEGIRDIMILDINGSSDPSGQASQSSSFVSDNIFMTKFAPLACTSYAGSISYCPNYCARTVTFIVDQSQTSGWNLEIAHAQNGLENFISANYLYDDDMDSLQNVSNGRKFSVSMPSGSYQAQFFDALNKKKSYGCMPLTIQRRCVP